MLDLAARGVAFDQDLLNGREKCINVKCRVGGSATLLSYLETL